MGYRNSLHRLGPRGAPCDRHDKAGVQFFDRPGHGNWRILGTKFPNFLLASHPLPKSIFWETTDRNFERKSLIFLARSDGQLSPIVPHHLCDEFAASSRLFDLKGEAKTDRRKRNNPNIVLPTLGDSVS